MTAAGADVRFSAILLTLAMMAACPVGAQSAVCAAPGPGCDAALEHHVVRSKAYWKPALSRPLLQRIGPAPDELVDFVTQDNIRNGFPNRPEPASLSADFLHDVRDAVSELPEPVRRRVSGKLAGIYFALDIGGTGFTDVARDASGTESVGFIVLDAAILDARMANAWATWKENTPFTPQPGYALTAEIEPAADDDRKNAIQFILLHELGHVLAIGEMLDPPWTVKPADVGDTSGYAYYALSWAPPNGEDHFLPRLRDRFPLRKSVVYYFGAELSLAQAAEVYEQLESTSFPSLYAATSPYEDWAEGFATYVHAVMMGKPFRIRVFRNGETTQEFRGCWEETRCAEKRKLIERFIRGSMTTAGARSWR